MASVPSAVEGIGAGRLMDEEAGGTAESGPGQAVGSTEWTWLSTPASNHYH